MMAAIDRAEGTVSTVQLPQTTASEYLHQLTSFISLLLSSLHAQSNVCQLKKLIELDVKNNRLASLPECLGNLKCLNTLCLTNNLLTSLPSSIGKLSELQELSIQ